MVSVFVSLAKPARACMSAQRMFALIENLLSMTMSLAVHDD